MRANVNAEALVKIAEDIATFAHRNQTDKNGHDYIDHPKAVFYRIYADDEQDYDGQVVAWLHDVLEDTKITQSTLDNFFPKYIVDAVTLLSRNLSAKGDKYYRDLKANPIALRVKLKDIEHNTSQKRMEKLPQEVQDRLRAKYAHALSILLY